MSIENGNYQKKSSKEKQIINDWENFENNLSDDILENSKKINNKLLFEHQTNPDNVIYLKENIETEELIKREYKRKEEYYQKAQDDISMYKSLLPRVEELVVEGLTGRRLYVDDSGFQYHHIFSSYISDEDLKNKAVSYLEDYIKHSIDVCNRDKYSSFGEFRSNFLKEKRIEEDYELQKEKERIEKIEMEKIHIEKVKKEIDLVKNQIVERLEKKGYYISRIQESPYSESVYVSVIPSVDYKGDYGHKIRISDHYLDNALLKITIDIDKNK